MIPTYEHKITIELKKDSLDHVCINSIRKVCAEIVEKANSGHPGAPIGCAPIAHALFGHVMRYAPCNLNWIHRDRFVMSNGHASALLYTMLQLTGGLEKGDLMKFRQLDSLTPGHPENVHTAGVEVTTGPLGQGVGQSVGLAIAAKQFGTLSNHTSHVFALCGDGCLNEGVALEAIALAGNLQLENLTLVYDRNGITIDGPTKLAFNENIPQLFQAYNWGVMYVVDGNSDITGLIDTFRAARDSDKPTLVVVDTTIGYGTKFEGTAKVHGAPLGATELQRYTQSLGLDAIPKFEHPPEVTSFYAQRVKELNLCYEQSPKFSVDACVDATGLELAFSELARDSKPESGRSNSQKCLKAIAKCYRSLIGGSADLLESNKTDVLAEVNGEFSAQTARGRYIRFGVREHGMVAVVNGIAAFGWYKPFCSTFLNFFSYASGAVRLAAISKLPILMIATHDSIELGEDGPTHQPIETFAHFRAMPNLITFRPADIREVISAYRYWLGSTTEPVVIALSRGATPVIENSNSEQAVFGAYIISDFSNNTKRKIILASSGSELHVAVDTQALLIEKYDVRVVSMPSWDLFAKQSKEYRAAVFPMGVPAAIMEPYASFGLGKIFDLQLSTTLDTFGYSAPAKHIFEKCGFTATQWAAKITQNYQ